MNGRDALRRAADYIDTHGWIRQSYGSEGGPVCTVGAINVVTGQIAGAIGFPEKGPAREAVRILVGHLDLEPVHQDKRSAYFHAGQAVADWNDRQTVQGRVTAVLREAAGEEPTDG